MTSYSAVALFQARLWVNGAQALVLLAAHLLVGEPPSTRGLAITVGFSLALALPLAFFFARGLQRPIERLPSRVTPRSLLRTRWEVGGITLAATAGWWMILAIPFVVGDDVWGPEASALYLAVIFGVFACVDRFALERARRAEWRVGAPVFLSRGRPYVEVTAPAVAGVGTP